jgi:hypothetical protein
MQYLDLIASVIIECNNCEITGKNIFYSLLKNIFNDYTDGSLENYIVVSSF